MKRGKAMRRKSHPARPAIWAEGHQKPKFSLRAFARVAFGRGRETAAGLLWRCAVSAGTAGAGGLAKRWALPPGRAGKIRDWLPDAARFDRALIALGEFLAQSARFADPSAGYPDAVLACASGQRGNGSATAAASAALASVGLATFGQALRPVPVRPQRPQPLRSDPPDAFSPADLEEERLLALVLPRKAAERDPAQEESSGEGKGEGARGTGPGGLGTLRDRIRGKIRPHPPAASLAAGLTEQGADPPKGREGRTLAAGVSSAARQADDPALGLLRQLIAESQEGERDLPPSPPAGITAERSPPPRPALLLVPEAGAVPQPLASDPGGEAAGPAGTRAFAGLGAHLKRFILRVSDLSLRLCRWALRLLARGARALHARYGAAITRALAWGFSRWILLCCLPWGAGSAGLAHLNGRDLSDPDFQP